MGKIVYPVKRVNKKIKNQKTVQLIGRVHSDENPVVMGHHHL
jgi:hypothetical protein